MNNSSSISILLVEDDEVAAEGLTRALRKAGVQNRIVRAVDGVEGLEILRGVGTETISRPFLILLDLYMPRMGGLEFLRVIRADEKLADSIVFVLTTSKQEEDLTQAWSRNIAGYIFKDTEERSLKQLVEFLRNYWEIVEIPTE